MKVIVKLIHTILLTIFFGQLYGQMNDIAIESGIIHSPVSPNLFGGGVAFVDINNDGLEDLYFTGGTATDKLYLNTGTGFKDISPESYVLLATKFTNSMAVSAADLNNDGYQDLFINTANGSPNILLMNNGDLTFSKLVSNESINSNKYYSMGSAIADFNRDGLLDIYVINYIEINQTEVGENDEFIFTHICYANELYINQGDFVFTEEAANWGVDDPGCGLAVAAVDINNDNYMDLYVVNDFGEWIFPNRVFINQGGESFIESSEELQLNDSIYGMGIGVGDINGDSKVDFYITNIGKNVLRVSNGQGSYDLVTDLYQVKGDSSGGLLSAGWGTAIEDFDGDGDLDMYLVNGYVPAENFILNAEKDPNELFLFENDKFVKAGSGDIQNDAVGHGVAYGDINNDGRYDLAVSNVTPGKYKVEDNVQVLKNQFNGGNNWIGLVLRGNTSNADAIGASVRVTTTGGKITRKRVLGGTSHASSNSKRLIFRYSVTDNVTELSITWPNGNEELFPIQSIRPNSYYFVEEGAGSIKSLGCNDEDITWGCEITVLGWSTLPFTIPTYITEDHVRITSPIDGYIVRDLLGRIIHKSNQVTQNLDFTCVTSGIYILQVQMGRGPLINQKILVKK